MGRKNKKVSKNKESTPAKVSKTYLVETMEIIRSVLEKASKLVKGVREEWENYQELHALIETIRQKQIDYVRKVEERDNGFAKFFSWLEENGVDTSAVQIGSFREGMGLQARRDIKAAEKFLQVSKRVMMSVNTAKQSVLGPIIAVDRVLQAMSNVALSLHVLFESVNSQSFWRPYLDILPSTYNTPLYFEPQDIELLRGSPVFSDVLSQYRSIARQYAYFFKLFYETPDSHKLPFGLFTYDDYRWAVSTVMTRQNQVPCDGGRQVLALVPLWDMCNHTEGEFTTDYNTEADCVECYAMRKFDADEQVLIYYGPRSNAEFFLNNGFLYSSNTNDRIEIKLGFSKTDPLYSKRCDILSRLTLLPSGRFQLHRGDDPVDSELLAYLRVFHMTEEELLARHSGALRDHVGKLRDFGELVSADNEMKCWQFLETRCSLLLKAYPETQAEDRQLLQSDIEMTSSEPSSLTDTQRSLVQLRYTEKCILQATLEFIDRYRQELEISIQEAKVESLKLADRQARHAASVAARDVTATTQNSNAADDDDEVDLDSVEALVTK